MEKNEVEKEIIKKIADELKWYDKLFIAFKSKLVISIYKNGQRQGFKWSNSVR